MPSPFVNSVSVDFVVLLVSRVRSSRSESERFQAVEGSNYVGFVFGGWGVKLRELNFGLRFS